MSASSKKKLRAEENAAKLTEKQLSERKEAKKLRIYTIAFGVVLAVMIVAFIWVGVSQTITNAGVREKKTVALTIGEHKINSVEMNYFYVDSINNFYSQYGSYAAMFGLDTTVPLDQQVLDEETGRTWADDFLESAQSAAQSAYAAADAAEAAGFTLPEETQDQLDQYSANLDTYAKIYGFSDADAYLKAMYGNGATLDSYKEYYRVNLLASGYQTEYRDSLTYTDEQVEAKDAEDPAVYNSYSYNQYYLSSSRYLDDDATNAEKAAAAEADAKSLVSDEINSVEALDAAIAALEVNADTTASSSAMDDTRYTSVSSVVAQWISDSSRQEGDKTYIANTSTTTDDDGNEVETISGYYVVYYRSSSDNSTPLVNVRHMLAGFEGGTTENGTTTYSDEEKAAAKEKAESWLQAWEDGDATEESFAALANENSTDTGSNTNGGLYENVYPGQMVSAFNNWCFDENRKAGDTGIVETSYGYHVMYFVGQSDETYREYLIKNDLTSEDYTNWYNGLVDALDMTVGDTSYIRTNLVMKAN